MGIRAVPQSQALATVTGALLSEEVGYRVIVVGGVGESLPWETRSPKADRDSRGELVYLGYVECRPAGKNRTTGSGSEIARLGRE